MKYHSFKKSLSLCAALLMLISSGGQTLSASAKRIYHHTKVTRKHFSSYYYRQNKKLYYRLIRYIREDSKDLHLTNRIIKHQKSKYLLRNLKKHKRIVTNRIKSEQRQKNKINRQYHFQKTIIVKKQAHKNKPQKHVSNYNNGIIISGNKPSSKEYNSSNATKPLNSLNNQINNEIDMSASNSQIDSISASQSASASSAESSIVNSEDGINSSSNKYTWISAGDGYDEKISVQSLSEMNNPTSNSAAAWDYINSLSSIYNSESNVANSDSMADTNTLGMTEEDFGIALGHQYAASDSDVDPALNEWSLAYAGQSSVAAQKLNSYYNQHSISPATQSADAKVWLTRDNYNPFQDITPTNYKTAGYSSRPAAGTDAGFEQALNDDGSDVENGDNQGFDGINGYM